MSDTIKANGWGAALKLAVRESRDKFRGFRIFAVALALGVFAIAAVGSVSAALLTGLEKEQSRLLGGDFEISVTDVALPEALLSWLKERGAVSQTVDAQLMVHREDRKTRSVVQLKAVDQYYPLLGTLEVSDGTANYEVAPKDFSTIDGQGAQVWKAFADQKLFDKLMAKPGDRITIGEASFVLAGVIVSEPDRASAGFLISPRLMLSLEGAKATGLLTRSGLVRNSARIDIKQELGEGAAEQNKTFAQSLKEAFPDNAWRVRSANDAARGLRRVLDNLGVFFTMVGLATLVIGGVGAANAVHAYMQRKVPVIATLKCIGATGDFIMKTYILQVLLVAIFAVTTGVALGASVPFIVVQFLGAVLPFKAAASFYWGALLQAAIFGLLAALTFAMLPLARARQASPAQLFRDLVENKKVKIARRDLLIIIGFSVCFIAMALIFSDNRKFTAIFALSGMGVYALLRGGAWGFMKILSALWRPSRPATRLALANLTRPGAATGSIIVSIGLGLTLLATIAMIDTNLSREIRDALPNRAPGLFFSDIEFQNASSFDDLISKIAPEAPYERFAMMRSGVRLLNGQPLESVEGAARSGWARQNDWGVSIMAKIPEDMGKIVSGEAWPADYSGPPLISLSARQAERFKLKVGDTITLNIAGRDVTPTIATLHKVNWDRNGINFVAIFAPGTLEAARPTSIGSLRAGGIEPEQEAVDAISERFPDVTIIRTREVTASIAEIIDGIGLVIRALSAVTLAAGLIVLLGAAAADFRRKLHDAMVMKTVGASRQQILASFGVEYALLGLVPALVAVILGAFGSWFVLTRQMELDWVFTPLILTILVGATLVTTFIIGMLAAWKTLGSRPWPILRSD